jgi:type I site-specific restriction endonuclease
MIKLNFPDFEFKLKKIDNKTFIFDSFRKKFILLTPEEWVRQHVLNFLVLKKIPITHIAVEKQIIINSLNKRFDIVIYNNTGDVIMLVECKSPSIKLTQNVFDQISIYNLNLNSKYCMVTNGLDHIYFKIDKLSKKFTFVKDFPIK